MNLFLLSVSIVCAEPPVQVAKTGQTTSYRTGDDGYWQKGVDSPTPRFTDNGDGTITDELTGLMWAKDANHGQMTWNAGIDYCNNLILGSESCSSSYMDWRLPNAKELQSLIDVSNYKKALPSGHPFLNVQSSQYWSSSTYAGGTDETWSAFMDWGYVFSFLNKTNDVGAVWPVRGGN